MRAWIDADGTLCVSAENSTEEYALTQWAAANIKEVTPTTDREYIQLPKNSLDTKGSKDRFTVSLI